MNRQQRLTQRGLSGLAAPTGGDIVVVLHEGGVPEVPGQVLPRLPLLGVVRVLREVCVFEVCW